MQDMSTQDAHRIGPQQALQSYLDDLLQEATPDRPAYAEAYSRPQPTPVAAAPAPAPALAPQPERAPAPAPRPMAHEPLVLAPRPLVLPTIKLTDIKLVEAPVDEAAAPIGTALAEPAPAPAPVIEVVNEPQPLAVSVAVSVSLSSSAPVAVQEAAAPMAERLPFREPLAESAPRELEAKVQVPLETGLPVASPQRESLAFADQPLAASSDEPRSIAAAPVTARSGEVTAPVEPIAAPPVAPSRTPLLRESVAPAKPVLMPSVLTTAAPPPVVEVAPPAAVPPLPPKVISGRPEWGENRFECLLFDVAGLTLAVPLVCLGTIHSMEGQTLTPLFGQPDWFLGMLKTHAGNIKVIDTARWVMPERYRDEFRENLSFVITIQGFDWGLAVHKVDRSIHLHPDQIKWRSLRTQRPWLAGTVIDHMCALLDVAALAELIESGALKHAR